MTTPYRPFDSSATRGGPVSVAVTPSGPLRGSILVWSVKTAIGESLMIELAVVPLPGQRRVTLQDVPHRSRAHPSLPGMRHVVPQADDRFVTAVVLEPEYAHTGGSAEEK